MEWDGDEKVAHSVIEGKVMNVVDREQGFIPGANVLCVLKEGTFPTTIITTGLIIWLLRCF